MKRKLEVSLSIGFPTAKHKEVLEIDLRGDETPKELEEIANEESSIWAYNYIEIGNRWMKEEENDD